MSEESNIKKLINTLEIKQVVFWGHKKTSNTFSYIFLALNHAFKYLNVTTTLWLDNTDKISEIDFTSTLFFTEGQVDRNIPIRTDCWYVIHNCKESKYASVLKDGKCIAWQVYTHRCLNDNVKKIQDYVYTSAAGRTIYMPWATDLLPFEINQIKKKIPTARNAATHSYFIGTIAKNPSDRFENISQMAPFQRACEENGIKFIDKQRLNQEENIKLIQTSYLAPAIQGPWQLVEGYIPCRIFKNISYGTFGITNSETVHTLFHEMITYNKDTFQLFFDAKEVADQYNMDHLFKQMDFVRDNHTYINRIDCLLSFLKNVSET